MLVITRKTNEEILIGENIILKVISNGNGRVKLGIEAPLHVRIARGEIVFGDEEPVHADSPNVELIEA